MPQLKLSSLDPEKPSNYREWRLHKLDLDQLKPLEAVILDSNLSGNEAIKDIKRNCDLYNFAIYQCESPLSETAAQTFCKNLAIKTGLTDIDVNLCAQEDGLSLIQDAPDESRSEYIPYTSKAINWHTDGYYNPPESSIKAFTLHCVRPALSGGANQFVDPELIYIQLRDENPAYITALIQPDVMNIPANISNNITIRAAQNGAVFSYDETTSSLNMRYTARTRSIEWKQDSLTQEAIQYLKTLMHADSPYVHKLRLQAGQGLVCNNILHTRDTFKDGENIENKRLYIRGRYSKRVS